MLYRKQIKDDGRAEDERIQAWSSGRTMSVLNRNQKEQTSEEAKMKDDIYMIVLRQDQNRAHKIVVTEAREGKRRRRRPKTTWRHTVEKGRKEVR